MKLGRMLKQDPELTAKYGPLNPDDISSYESRSGQVGDLTVYGYGEQVDLEKSRKLADYRKRYGAALDNMILGKNMRLFGQGMQARGLYQPGGKDLLQAAQDEVLLELENQGRTGERMAAEKKGLTLRQARNPMLF